MALSAGARRVREAGFASLKQFREVSRTADFQDRAAAYAKANNISVAAASRATSRFTRLYGQAFYFKGAPRKRISKAAGGRLARLLVSLGFRERGAVHAVGDTPKKF